MILNAKLAILAIVITASTSLLIGASAFIEQIVKAQNMAGKNMTDSAGNMTETDNASGEISSIGDSCRACK
jgi:hypothetical protein